MKTLHTPLKWKQTLLYGPDFDFYFLQTINLYMERRKIQSFNYYFAFLQYLEMKLNASEMN